MLCSKYDLLINTHEQKLLGMSSYDLIVTVHVPMLVACEALVKHL